MDNRLAKQGMSVNTKALAQTVTAASLGSQLHRQIDSYESAMREFIGFLKQRGLGDERTLGIAQQLHQITLRQMRDYADDVTK